MRRAGDRGAGRTTEGEFLSWPESMAKRELFDGSVVCSPSPTTDHQETLRRLLLELGIWARGRRVFVGQSPLDVRFAPGRILQPDAFVILEPVSRLARPPLERVPELCVEVLSTDIAYDRDTKRSLYGNAGVAELWLVSGAGWIERRTGPRLADSEIITGVLRTPLLVDFALDVPSLFSLD